MSDEQLAEAGAELIQRYLALKKRLALINSKMTGWTQVFGRLSREMPLFTTTGIPQECLRYPMPGEFQSAIEDLRKTADELAVARQQMQSAGLDLS
jgi:hypothetical protein